MMKKIIISIMLCVFAFCCLACGKKNVENAVGKVHYRVEYHNEVIYDNDLDIDNNSVYDLLEKAKLEYDMKTSIAGVYVTSIANHTEKETGPLSGWAYYINDEYANTSCDKYICKNGDVIIWKYIDG